MQISLALSAVQDLTDTLAYYRDQDVPEVGDGLASEIFAHIEKLEHFPDLGLIVPEFQMAQLRELIHPPFRIVYFRETKRVRVVRVWRSERQLKLP